MLGAGAEALAPVVARRRVREWTGKGAWMRERSPQTAKMTSKMAPRRPPETDPEQAKIKRPDSLLIFACSADPCWPERQPQDSHKMAQDAAEAPKMTSKMALGWRPRATPSRQKSRGQMAS